MSEPNPSALPERDYREIETALAGTVRGRRFLSEFARRSRRADTQALLDAIAALERHVAASGPRDDTAPLRLDPKPLLDEIRHAQAEIAGSAGGDPARPGHQPGEGLLRASQRATTAIRDGTEQIQETAWTMRESGFDPALCDMLDQRAAEIYRNCADHDRCSGSLKRNLELFARLEQRLGSLTAIDGPDTRAGPPPDLGERSLRDDTDPVPGGSDQRLPAPDALGPDTVESGRGKLSPPGAEPRDVAAARERALAELARFEALDIRDKLRLFT